MSAVRLTDATSLALMCDTCGRSLAGLSASGTGWQTLWELATDQGWVGTASQRGPHACPACAEPAAPVTISRWGPLQAALHCEDQTAVVRLCGDLDARVAEALRALMYRAGTARCHIVVDMAAVHLIDSVGLGVLVRARQARRQAGGLLVLAAPSRFIRTVLHTMHLDPVFPVLPDPDAALAWLLARSAAR